MTFRQFTMEGCLHLFSSPPSVLTPADIYRVADNRAARSFLAGSNVYLITCRPRILIDADYFQLVGGVIFGHLLVVRDGTWRKVPFRYGLGFEQHLGRPEHCNATVLANGTGVLIENGQGQVLVAVHVIIAAGMCELSDEERDLHVLYVGQGMGKDESKLAVDRLSRHSTFQRILADFHTHHPELELLILLFRFEHQRKLMSSGGDLTLEPRASEIEDREHIHQMHRSRFERRKRVTLAEAALISFFKPRYNDIFKRTNFYLSGKLKFLESLVKQDMVGFIVEICTGNARARLYSESRPPVSIEPEAHEFLRAAANDPKCGDEARLELQQMMTSHFIKIPLTSAEERDSFLHGMRWRDGDIRESHF